MMLGLRFVCFVYRFVYLCGWLLIYWCVVIMCCRKLVIFVCLFEVVCLFVVMKFSVGISFCVVVMGCVFCCNVSVLMNGFYSDIVLIELFVSVLVVLIGIRYVYFIELVCRFVCLSVCSMSCWF